MQVTEAKVRDGMELVEQPKDKLYPCYCASKKVCVLDIKQNHNNVNSFVLI